MIRITNMYELYPHSPSKLNRNMPDACMFMGITLLIVSIVTFVLQPTSAGCMYWLLYSFMCFTMAGLYHVSIMVDDADHQ